VRRRTLYNQPVKREIMLDKLNDTTKRIGPAAPWRSSLPKLAWALAVLVGGCGLEATDLQDQANPIEDLSAENIGTTEQGLAEATCGHSICEPGFAVSSLCDTCVTRICSADAFCCSVSWDGVCVSEVSSICGLGPQPVSKNTTVSKINVRITTGGDDIRGGSQAYGSFQLVTGGSLPKVSLNNGANFPNNSVRTAIISFSNVRTLGSLAGFTLEWDGAPRNIFDSYDNWNANEFRFFLEPPAGHCPAFLGTPFIPGRMTGSRTIANTSVNFP
jgi:hypothetical protein